jgi:hypothetical protein
LDFALITSIGESLTGIRFFARAGGLTVHPNHLAQTVAMAMPVALALHVHPNLGSRVTKWFLVALLLLGTLVSGSRAGILGVAVGVLLSALLGQRATRREIMINVGTIVILFGVVVLLVADARSLLVAWQRLTGAVSAEAANRERIDLLRQAFSDLAYRPLLGVGFTKIRGAHDLYLQLWHAGGVLAVSAFGVFTLGTLGCGVNEYRQRSHAAGNVPLPVALTISMLVWLILGLVQNQVYDRYLYLPAALLLGFRSAGLRWTRPAGAPVHL